MKYINAYRLQYWLYAILNKSFGKMVSMERDSLHRRYEVNRHGFYVSGVPHKIVITQLSIILKDAGYIEEKSGENITLTKSVKKGDRLEKHYVNLNVHKLVSSNKEILTVNPSVYFQKV